MYDPRSLADAAPLPPVLCITGVWLVRDPAAPNEVTVRVTLADGTPRTVLLGYLDECFAYYADAEAIRQAALDHFRDAEEDPRC